MGKWSRNSLIVISFAMGFIGSSGSALALSKKQCERCDEVSSSSNPAERKEFADNCPLGWRFICLLGQVGKDWPAEEWEKKKTEEKKTPK